MRSPNFSDQELIVRLQDNDRAAFTQIYERYWKKLLMIAWNHTNDKYIAEDIVHEVFISLWNEKYNLPIINVGGFLATKIKFAVFKHFRKQQRRSKLAAINYDFSEECNDEEKLDALFLEEYLKEIVEELPERCRLVFKYSRQLGMKNSEIAVAMDISEKGVEANLTRALKIIRNNLEAAGMIFLISGDILKNLNS